MKLKSVGFGALAGLMLTAPLVAIMYLANKWFELSFPPFDAFDWVARMLPGPMVTFGIDLMVDSLMLIGMSVKDFAKTAEQIMAIGIFLGAGVVATIVIFGLVERRIASGWRYLGVACGAIIGAPIAIITASIGQSPLEPTTNFVWTMLVSVIWGASAVGMGRRLLLPIETTRALDDSGDVVEEPSVEVLGRRQFLVRMGVATATVTVAGAGIGRIMEGAEQRRLEEEQARLEEELQRARAELATRAQSGASAQPTAAPPISDMLPNADDPLKAALGTRPEYTAVRDHYQIFIRSTPTRIEEADWTLPITGLVSNPLTLTLSDIMMNYEPRSEFVTLSCISNRIGGDLISTTYWTGVSLQDILADVRPTDEAQYLIIECGDGFYETVDLDLINADKRVMLAYAWDEKPIPWDHGFPLRIWIPDRFGMKQPKWITSIEVVSEYKAGYWVERNWDKDAIVRATSVIDTVAVDAIVEEGDQKLIPIGGIAYAGARGISKVEVRVNRGFDSNDPADEGPWMEAQLREPLSDVSWVIWRYDWPFEDGEWEFEVRCVEKDGSPQIEEFASPRPSGATGIHRRTKKVEAKG